MKNKIKPLIFILVFLVVYSVVLIVMEFNHGEEFIRPYFSDISESSRFFAINTTLSVSLTWTCMLIAGLMMTMIDKDEDYREYLFLGSQVLIFFMLGFDDRFQIHEGVHNRLHIDEAFLYLGYGIAELGFLYFLGGVRVKNVFQKPNIYLIFAGLFYFVMTIIDTVVPESATLRLSIEDLSKTWAGLFLVMFFWGRFSDRVSILKQQSRS